jgi:hypothetical protein
VLCARFGRHSVRASASISFDSLVEMLGIEYFKPRAKPVHRRAELPKRSSGAVNRRHEGRHSTLMSADKPVAQSGGQSKTRPSCWRSGRYYSRTAAPGIEAANSRRAFMTA